MEKFKNLIQWISNLPLIGKVLSVICIIIAFIVMIFFASSCGASRSTVRIHNRAEGTTTSVSMTNGNGGSTSVTVSPDVTVSVDSSRLF